MSKKIIAYIFFVIFLVIFIITSFYYSIYVCNSFYKTDENDTHELAAIPDEMYALPSGDIIIYGAYNYGTKQNKSFYKIYNKDGSLITHTTIGTDGRTINITGFSIEKNGFVFTCVDSSNSDYMDVDCVLYKVDSEYNIKEKILLESQQEQNPYYNIVPVNNSDGLFACVSTSSLDIYSLDGNLVKNISISGFAKVLCASQLGEQLLIGGSLAPDELLDSFTCAFVCAYDMQGNQLWLNKYQEGGNKVATIVSLKYMNNGNVMAYGRYLDYSRNLEEGDILVEMSVDEFYRLTYYGNHTQFNVTTPDGIQDYTLQASVFLQTIDGNGENIKNVDYNVFDDYAVPMIVDVIDTKPADFTVLTTYRLYSYKARTYNIDITILDNKLETISSHSIVPNDRTEICFTMNDKQNIYIYRRLGGTDKYGITEYAQVSDLSEQMKIVNIAMQVRDVFIKIQGIIEYIAIGFIVFFTQSIKAMRRYD